jgi:hypothetical protein
VVKLRSSEWIAFDGINFENAAGDAVFFEPDRIGSALAVMATRADGLSQDDLKQR